MNTEIDLLRQYIFDENPATREERFRIASLVERNYDILLQDIIGKCFDKVKEDVIETIPGLKECERNIDFPSTRSCYICFKFDDQKDSCYRLASDSSYFSNVYCGIGRLKGIPDVINQDVLIDKAKKIYSSWGGPSTTLVGWFYCENDFRNADATSGNRDDFFIRMMDGKAAQYYTSRMIELIEATGNLVRQP